ncbi:MAG: hypothetical protein EXX96DRAFT_479343 [Benjaminiella poitrasii]|nr:MAG: hypothetical protein EXX96DRAFT_479343 [Benjaminiella poitrasii]
MSRPTSIVAQINKSSFTRFNSTSNVINITPNELDTDGPHSLLVVAENTLVDDNQQFIGLQAILVDDTAITVTPPPSSVTKPVVEFVGHDLTLGTKTTHNILTSFGWMMGELLDLDHIHVAYPNATLIDGLEKKYFDEQASRSTKPWSVVILLGSNDRKARYSPSEYYNALIGFLTKVRQRLDEEAPIFILSEPLGDMFRPSQQAVYRRGDQHIYFIDTTAWLRYGSAYYIDDDHLTDAGHELFAKKLALLLKIKLTNPREPLPGPPPNPNLPGDWQTMDIGAESHIGLPGTVSSDSSTTFILWGSGADIDNDNDAFRFVYQPFSSQGMIESTVRSHSAFAKCAKAGIMIREHLGPGAPLIMLGISPADGIFVQIRYGNFESTQLIKNMRASPPYRLRLARQKENHDMFEAQIRHVDAKGGNDGDWETLVQVPFVLARDVYAGLAVTSCDTSVVSVAKFTDVGLYHSASILTTTTRSRLIDQQQ